MLFNSNALDMGDEESPDIQSRRVFPLTRYAVHSIQIDAGPVLVCQGGDTLGVIEVFNKYLRQDDIGDGNSVAPTLVTYNLVRYIVRSLFTFLSFLVLNRQQVSFLPMPIGELQSLSLKKQVSAVGWSFQHRTVILRQRRAYVEDNKCEQ